MFGTRRTGEAGKPPRVAGSPTRSSAPRDLASPGRIAALMDELTPARRKRAVSSEREEDVDEPHKRGRLAPLSEHLSAPDDISVHDLLQRAHCLLELTVLQEAAVDPSGVSLPMILRPSMQSMLTSGFSTIRASPTGKENRRAGL